MFVIDESTRLNCDGYMIAELVFHILSSDYDAEQSLQDILGIDYLPDDLVDMMMDDPEGPEVRYRFLCLGLSACTVLPPKELITFVTEFSSRFGLTERDRLIIKKCYRAAGLRKHPLPE